MEQCKYRCGQVCNICWKNIYNTLDEERGETNEQKKQYAEQKTADS